MTPEGKSGESGQREVSVVEQEFISGQNHTESGSQLLRPSAG